MYQIPKKDDWKGRIDATDGASGLRWHQVIQLLDLSQPLTTAMFSNARKIAFLGFCSDEGVKRNFGRPGASKGPFAIRAAISNLAVHFSEDKLLIYDAGDVLCTQRNLEGAQEQLAVKIKLLLDHDFFPVVLGGGHEVAYGHFNGIYNHLKEKTKPGLGIINFDAHFDLRNITKEATSGTPFRQILEDNPDYTGRFPYLCLGIQEASNTKALFETADVNRVKYIFSDKLNFRHLEKLNNEIKSFVDNLDQIYISVDMDVFAAAFAPGVSAPNGNGIFPDIAIHLLKEIITSGKVMSLDIAELNPDLDVDNRTAKLAAGIIYEIIKAIKKL